MAGFDLCNPTDAHLALRRTLRLFCEQEIEPQAAEYDELERFNEALFRRLGSELNLFGLTVPETDGGIGLDPVASVIACEEISRCDPSLGLSYLAHEILFVNNFYFSADSAQRERVLPTVLDGGAIGGMAMTEPSAGTDVLSMKTTALRKGDVYLLNGVKQFCTNGSVGDVFIVYAKTEDQASRSLSAFVVDAKESPITVGGKEKKMGMRASPTAQLIFEDCEVPAANLLGEEGGALVHMMRNLEIERVALAAQSVGIALRCLDVMCRYSISEREAFGKALIDFGQVQRLVAESYADTQAARALVYQVALAIGPDTRCSLDASSAKLVATPVAERVARNAIQVLGGYGYTRDFPVERMLRDAILLSIGGGTVEAMQKNIAADLKRSFRGL